ncbi:MAG: hypothetical protein N4A62_07835 [Marinisporobacter sp.]|jgi:TolA-binding protein|nr:hypothetical protein [Marinisporobacter sp.]
MNKKMKKLLTLFMSGTIILSSFIPSLAAEKKEVIEEFSTFKEFIQEIKDIKKDDLKKLETLYNDAISFEKQEKFTDADKQWDVFDGILEKYDNIPFDEIGLEDPSFKDFIKDLDVTLKNADIQKLEKLYNDAIALEKNKKITDADKKWHEFDTLLDKYCDFKDISFDDFMKDFQDLKIKKDDLKALKEIYNKAISFEKNKKLTNADEQWDKFFNILDKYAPAKTCSTADES